MRSDFKSPERRVSTLKALPKLAHFRPTASLHMRRYSFRVSFQFCTGHGAEKRGSFEMHRKSSSQRIFNWNLPVLTVA